MEPLDHSYQGTLFLIPIPLFPHQINTIPDDVKNLTMSIRHFFVENSRTARRYLKSIAPSLDVDHIFFSEVNRHQPADLDLLKQWLNSGNKVGIMSEAGCPGIADPGSVLVARAHELNAKVVPLTGPNSIILALMASGLNGQGFRFTGYLPAKGGERKNAIKALEALSRKSGETQAFIETPYRNQQLLADLLRYCTPSTKICVAVDLTDPEKESVRTKTVAQWKLDMPTINKRPAVFLLMAG